MLGKKRNNSVFLKEEKQQNVAFEDYSLAENETINVESIADTVKDSNVHDVNKQKMAILNVSERAIEMLEIHPVLTQIGRASCRERV